MQNLDIIMILLISELQKKVEETNTEVFNVLQVHVYKVKPLLYI